MEHIRILIVDPAPERAEEVNSLLRNSGINIRVSCAPSVPDAEQAMQSETPLLLMCNAAAFESVSVSKFLALADRHAVLPAVRFGPGEAARLAEVLQHGSCLAIDSQDDQQLIDTVQLLLKRDRALTQLSNEHSRLDELQSRHNLLLDSSKEATAYLHEGLHVYANPAYLELLQADDLAAIEALSLIDLASTEALDLKQLLREMSRGSFPESAIDVRIQACDGGSFDAQLAFSPARYEGEDCIQMMLRQQDAQARLKDELDRLRRTDVLTRLSNRGHFFQELRQFIASADQHQAHSAVFYLEPDGIEDIQGSLGINGFDRCILALANVIRECIKSGDLAARFNDHGFTILASREQKQELKALGERIVSRFTETAADLNEDTLPISCSVGLAPVGPQTRDAEEAVSQAHHAFQESGGEPGRLRTYRPPVAAVSNDPEDQKWAERVRYALNNNDLYSIQQSIVNLDGDFDGLFENRIYMRAEGQDLPSEVFLPSAERNDLGTAIDRHVIPGLLKAIAGSGDRHIIQLSANSILDFSFPSWFQHQAEELGVEGSQLIVQIAAPAAATNLKPCKRLAEEIRASGCGLCLSDFDEQPRHASLLQHLQVDMIKLRPGLAQAVASNSAQQDIIRGVVFAADSAGTSVIADGVQDAADLAVLWQCGVKLVSGEFLKESSQVVGQ